MVTKLKKKVIDGIAPVTIASCVMMGDGTENTVEERLNKLTAGTTNNKYAGKTALWLGDSISVVNGSGDGTSGAGGTYPQLVCNALGMTLTNKASSGGNSVRMRNILQGNDDYTAIDCSGFDYAFIKIGHNCDYAEEGLTTGTSSISDIPTDSTAPADFPTTFHGNVASCIEYILSQNPKCNIFLITPIWSNAGRYIATTPKAAVALKEVGDFYGVPVIDLHGESGISRKNASTWTYDGIHPNTDGVKRLADIIVAYLKCH